MRDGRGVLLPDPALVVRAFPCSPIALGMSPWRVLGRWRLCPRLFGRERTKRQLGRPLASGVMRQQKLVALDVEGVLIPEVWISLSRRTGIEALAVTTRDEPDYDSLMRKRLAILDSHGVNMSDLRAVLADMGPLEGAREFLDGLRAAYPVVLLSDTFEQFAAPLLPQLGMPTILCHRLQVADDHIVDYVFRIDDHKRRAVEAFRALNYEVIAVGDAYNDLSMLRAADAGALVHAPPKVAEANPDLPAFGDYGSLRAWIDSVGGDDPEPR